MSERHARFNGLFNVNALTTASATIVGCGSVGASLAHLLARVGVGTLHLWDPDTVSEPNLGVQPFFADDLDRYKTAATSGICGALNPNVTVNPQSLKFRSDEYKPEMGTIFSCVDNMRGRRHLAETAIHHNVPFFDARVAGHTVETYYWLPGTDPLLYLNTLFPDSEMLEMPCGTKMTPHAPAVAAAILYSLFAAHLSGNPLPRSGASLDLSILAFVDS